MSSRSRRAPLVLAFALGGALLLGTAAGLTAALPWAQEHELVVLSPQGAGSFGLQVAATADGSWRPAESDWRPAGRRAPLSVPLTADGRAYDLPPGTSATLYVYVRNSSPQLTSVVGLGVEPPPQSPDKDALFGQLGFRADTAGGRTVLHGTGRSQGRLGELAPGEAVRLTLTVSLPADTPTRYLDRTTGVCLRVDAENR